MSDENAELLAEIERLKRELARRESKIELLSANLGLPRGEATAMIAVRESKADPVNMTTVNRHIGYYDPPARLTIGGLR